MNDRPLSETQRRKDAETHRGHSFGLSFRTLCASSCLWVSVFPSAPSLASALLAPDDERQPLSETQSRRAAETHGGHSFGLSFRPLCASSCLWVSVFPSAPSIASARSQGAECNTKSQRRGGAQRPLVWGIQKAALRVFVPPRLCVPLGALTCPLGPLGALTSLCALGSREARQ
jgi:hypothetical protein